MADRSYKLTLSLSDGSTINAGTITAPQGPNGANGATFTPSVSAAGVLSWTNNGGLTNPSPISIKGPKGDDAIITASDVENWGFTKNTGTITEIKMNGVSKGTSGVVDLGTVLIDASKFATSAQGTKADNAMPKAGGAFTGAVTIQAPTVEMNPATKQYVDTAINAVKQFEYQVVTELPTAAQATMGKIYLKAHSHNPSDGQPDSYDEFITVQSGSTYKWERIGNTDIDLSGYVPTTRKINNKALSSNITLYPTDVGVTEEAFPGLNKIGTVTAIKINGATKNPASGVVDLGTFLTSQDISGLQDKLTTEQLNAVNSGITKAKVSTYDGYATSKQDKLSTAQLGAVNSGITAAKVGTYDGYANKITALEGKPGLDKVGTVTSVSVKMNGASKGTVTSSGTIDLGTVITAHQDISGKLDKTTYEVNKTIAFGSSGVLYVGKFKVYDTNVTCEVTSTTDVTYSGKLVIATQNHVIKKMTVYGDAANAVAPNFFVKPSTTSDPYIEVYFKPSSWSKNVIHIYGSAIAEAPTDVCTNASAVPSTATEKPINALTYLAAGDGGYSLNASGYVKGSWLQSSAMYNKGSNTGKVCVFDNAGWIYYRTPEEVLFDGGLKKKLQNYQYEGPSTQNITLTTEKWISKTWTGLTSFWGSGIWTDGDNIYYSSGSDQYVLNKTTSTWSEKTWSGLTSFNGSYVWTDGDNIYCSNGSNQYVLDKVVSTWRTKTWSGLTSFDGDKIWTDGDNIYYATTSSTYYVLSKDGTWTFKTWSGKLSIRADYVWTDGDNIYFSGGSKQCVLSKIKSLVKAKPTFN